MEANRPAVSMQLWSDGAGSRRFERNRDGRISQNRASRL